MKPSKAPRLDPFRDRCGCRRAGPGARGDANALEASVGTYLGPIFRVRQGQRVLIDLTNELPESTIVHWQGLHLPEPIDDHLRYAIGPDIRRRESTCPPVADADHKHHFRRRVPARTKAKPRAATEEHMAVISSEPERVKAYFRDLRVKYAV